MPELQTIPARHGVATFVPAGKVIKIINTSGTQVVDTWAFALPKPDSKKGEQAKGNKIEEKDEDGKPDLKANEKPKPRGTPKKGKKDGFDLPSQEEAEQATRDGIAQGEQASQDASKNGAQKSSWTSYVPSLGWSGGKKDGAQQQQQQPTKEQAQAQQQKDSKTWGSYFPSGKAFGNYIPKTASDTVASFTSTHQRDPNKSYLEQLQDFSKTPVGAAGMSVMTGSGYSSSLYAGYQAWNATHAADAPMMEFMSMPHTRAGTLHMRPKVNDTLLSNLREPILTLIEDSSPGIHDTLIAACDPQRYQGLGVDKWEEHGSCAENLVLALKELNERAGLKGAKGVGADVMINNVPAPLNLFMNIPWNDNGDVSFEAPKSKEGDFVRFRAVRDVVVVMSACPQDILNINNNKPTDANFIVEGDDDSNNGQKRPTPRKRPAPRKINSSTKPPSTVATGDMGDDDKSQVGSTPAKKPAPRKVPAKKTTAPAQTGQNAPAKAGATVQQAPRKKPVPRPVNTPVKASTPAAETNGTATQPAEKKKPRKLNKAAPATGKTEG